MTPQRYEVQPGSDSGHCCFEYTVVDTRFEGITVCECFEEGDALLVCKALNLLETVS